MASSSACNARNDRWPATTRTERTTRSAAPASSVTGDNSGVDNNDQYYQNTYDARETTLRQLGRALPVGVRISGY